jgi:hypothetical protein
MYIIIHSRCELKYKNPETTIRISISVAKKIKHWAIDFNVTPSEYLNLVVPDVKIEEDVTSCQTK